MSVLFLYRLIGGRSGSAASRRTAARATRSPAASQATASQRVGHFRAGVLGVGMVDVETGAVAEDHVHQQGAGLVLAVGFQLLPAVGQGHGLGVEHGRLVGQLVRVGPAALQRPAAGVVQRFLVRVVPAGFGSAGGALPGHLGVGLDHPGATSWWRWPPARTVRGCRIRSPSPSPAWHRRREARRDRRRASRHSGCHRYWPVLGIVSMDLPGSWPALPWTMVRM